MPHLAITDYSCPPSFRMWIVISIFACNTICGCKSECSTDVLGDWRAGDFVELSGMPEGYVILDIATTPEATLFAALIAGGRDIDMHNRYKAAVLDIHNRAVSPIDSLPGIIWMGGGIAWSSHHEGFVLQTFQVKPNSTGNASSAGLWLLDPLTGNCDLICSMQTQSTLRNRIRDDGALLAQASLPLTESSIWVYDMRDCGVSKIPNIGGPCDWWKDGRSIIGISVHNRELQSMSGHTDVVRVTLDGTIEETRTVTGQVVAMNTANDKAYIAIIRKEQNAENPQYRLYYIDIMRWPEGVNEWNKVIQPSFDLDMQWNPEGTILGVLDAGNLVIHEVGSMDTITIDYEKYDITSFCFSSDERYVWVVLDRQHIGKVDTTEW